MTGDGSSSGPAARPDTFDGVIIGAGQHGLILGCYLAKAGLRVALVDRRMQYGGGLMSEEVTLPGFVHSSVVLLTSWNWAWLGAS